MSADILKAGYVIPHFDKDGNFQQTNASLVVASVPGENGEWMYVVKDRKFAWVKGLPEGQGYQEYSKPEFALPEEGIIPMIQAIVEAGIPEGEAIKGYTVDTVAAGTVHQLDQEGFSIVSK